MKKSVLLLLVVLLVCMFCYTMAEEDQGVKINKEHFPDSLFLKTVKKYDRDENGYLSAEEIENITVINLQGMDVETLKGIEFLTSLEVLNCEGNKLTELDLKTNKELTSLYCDNNKLTALNVKENTQLENLDCENNQLKKLDLTGNTALEKLKCGLNQLTELDLCQNTNLVTLYCQENNIKELDLSRNTELEEVNCRLNVLESLNVNQCSNLTELYCELGYIAELDVSQCAELEILICEWNQLKKLDVSQNTILKELYCGTNKLTELDISKNTELKTLSCYENTFREMDISGCPDLRILDCENCGLTELDISGCKVIVDMTENNKPKTIRESVAWSVRDEDWERVSALTVNWNTKIYKENGELVESGLTEPEIRKETGPYDMNENGRLSKAAMEEAWTERNLAVEYTSAYPDILNPSEKTLFDFFCSWSQNDANVLTKSFISAQKIGSEDVQTMVAELQALGTPVSYQINDVYGGDGYNSVYECTTEMAHIDGEPARYVQIEIGIKFGWMIGAQVISVKTVEATEYNLNKKIYSLAPDAVIPDLLAAGLYGNRTDGELQPIGESSEAEGIRIELISGLLQDDKAWFFYSVEDVERKYGDCDLFAFPNTYIGDNDLGIHDTLYHDVQAHKSYHLVENHFKEKVDMNEREVTASTGYIEVQQNEWMDLSELLTQYVGEAENVTMVPSDVWYYDKDNEDRKLTEEEKKILDYNKPLDIQVTPDIMISGIGWIDGKLHVQIKGTNYDSSQIFADGVPTYYNDKSLSYSPLYWYKDHTTYVEYMFDYKPEDVEKLKLVLEVTVNRNDPYSDSYWTMEFPLSRICPDGKAEGEQQKPDF